MRMRTPGGGAQQRSALLRGLLAGSGVALKRTELQRKAPLRRQAQLKRAIAVNRVSTRRGGVSRSTIEALDELARIICFTLQGAYRIEGSRSWVGGCRMCGQLKPLQLAHFNSRRIHALRWCPDNVMGLCGGCHFNVAHHKPAEFRDWWRNEIGSTRFDRLALRLKTARRPDYAGLLVALKQQRDQLGA